MISSHDLSTLFDSTRREAQGLLPQLVRRLILASCADSELPHFEMAAGDDVRLPGWDGALTYDSTHPYVPSGHSVWEMGVSTDAESKADEDYEKRTQDPRGATPASSTFVFVTPRVWSGRTKWAENKRTEGAWADVRVIDGSVLASWLERVPAVALWIADALGRPIQGLHSVDRYWDSAVGHQYASNITPALIIGGREAARDRLIQFLQSPSGAISLIGETVEEAVAFVTAVCRQSFTPEQRSRLLVLSEPTATEHLATLSQDHVVILTNPALYPTVRSEVLDHLHFVLPEMREARTNKATDSIDLGTLVRKATAAALHEMGLPEEEPDHIASDSKGSLQAVLWMIAQPERGTLDWATGRAASELAPLVLAGQWMVNDHPDHEVVAKLAQREYSEIKQTLAEWSGPGKPLDRRGAIWEWKAWSFAWTRLAPALQRDDVDRFLKIAKEVLGAADPALQLPPEDRWLADIRGETRHHSSALREGLARSLVLLAMNGNLLQGTDGQAAANHFVESLLKVSEPAPRWISIASWLPDLAEAAPDAFLDALELLIDDQAAIAVLFTEGGMFGSSPHTHVLWALERLAWSPDHFGRVVLAFARLASVDPGGGLVNRPWRSLRMILLPWHPASGASIADRIGAVRLLFKHVEPTAWRCAASLLPQAHDIGNPFARPKWRAWAKDTTDRVTARDYWTFQEQLVETLLDHAEHEGERWTQLLNAAPELHKKHPELGRKVIESIRGLDPTQFAREGARVLGDAARALVMHNENMHETDWAMKGEDLETFKQLREHLRPRMRRDRDRWLFADWPEVLRDHDLSQDERRERLRVLRAEAVSAVLNEEGLDALLTWAGEVEHPESLGATLAEQDVKWELRLLETGYAAVGAPTTRPPLARLLYGYVSTKSRVANMGWREQTLSYVREHRGPLAAAFFLESLIYGEETWSLVEGQDEEVQSIYWHEIGPVFLNLKECETATPKLIAANRPFKVLDLTAMLLHDMRSLSNAEHDRIVALARKALDAKIDHLPREELGVSGTISHEIDQLLTYLESRGVQRNDLARWEWSWLPLISNGTRKLSSLQAELSENPALFVDLLKCVYRPRNTDATHQDSSEDDRNRAGLAHQLLVTWTRTPGLSANALYRHKDTLGEGLGPISPAWTGSINEVALTAWVLRATELAADADRLDMCNQHIGRQFAYAPADSDGVWPCVEIRTAIERARNDDLDKGLMIAVYNRRGFHCVGRDGAQETIMAHKFREWCERVRLEYPRTGAVLRRLADGYEREATSEVEQGQFEEFRS